MFLIELLSVVEFIYILPAAAGEGLHIGGEADIAEDAIPVQGVGEVGEGFAAGVRGEVAAGEKDSLGHRDTVTDSQAVVKEFLIGAPPERVIDDGGAGEGGVLQIGPIERYVL